MSGIVYRHHRWVEFHPAVPKPGTEVENVRATGKPGAECQTCGEAIWGTPDEAAQIIAYYNEHLAWIVEAHVENYVEKREAFFAAVERICGSSGLNGG